MSVTVNLNGCEVQFMHDRTFGIVRATFDREIRNLADLTMGDICEAYYDGRKTEPDDTDLVLDDPDWR